VVCELERPVVLEHLGPRARREHAEVEHVERGAVQRPGEPGTAADPQRRGRHGQRDREPEVDARAGGQRGTPERAPADLARGGERVSSAEQPAHARRRA
jgi:hypothetical protein